MSINVERSSISFEKEFIEAKKSMRAKIPRPITIVYRRLPNQIREFPGILLQANARKLVIQSPIRPSRQVKAFGNIITDEGYTAIWFIYRNRWYDVGKFYDKSRNWIGYYCDILKPIRKLLDEPSRTAVLTDLFLDLWVGVDGRHIVLDEDELEQALRMHQISASLARQARRVMKGLVNELDAHRFPPASVRAMHLQRTTR